MGDEICAGANGAFGPASVPGVSFILSSMPVPRVQRYVSNELSHFVGRAATNDDARFEVLRDIVAGHELLPPEVLHHRRRGGRPEAYVRSVGINHQGTLSGNDKYLPTVVCFCDIPIDDLYLHTQKYGSFGIAFTKPFLAAQGACPVLYIPREGWTSWQVRPERNETRAEMYDRLDTIKTQVARSIEYDKFQRLSPAAHAELQRIGIVAPWDPWSMYEGFLSTELLPFLKFFDLATPEDHPDNFYMEREWRVVGSVTFQLEDLERVFLPRQYATRWRECFPHYAGQITFV